AGEGFCPIVDVPQAGELEATVAAADITAQPQRLERLGESAESVRLKGRRADHTLGSRNLRWRTSAFRSERIGVSDDSKACNAARAPALVACLCSFASQQPWSRAAPDHSVNRQVGPAR